MGCSLLNQLQIPLTDTNQEDPVEEPTSNGDSPDTDCSDTDAVFAFFDPSIFVVHILNLADDERPHTEVLIANRKYSGLLDSGSSVTVMKWSKELSRDNYTHS